MRNSTSFSRFTPCYLLITALIFLSACSSQPVVNYEQINSITAEDEEVFSADSERLLAAAETKHDAASKAEMNFYAPAHMRQASEKLDLARDFALKGLPDESIAASSKVIQLLRLAEKNKTSVETMLQPLLKQKLILEQLNTPLVLSDQFNHQLDSIQKLIEDIESNEAVITENTMLPILNEMKQLELDTLLTIHWQPAKETLEKAKDENADDNAPRSFAIANQMVEQSETIIRNNFGDRKRVAAEGLKALRAAQHALYIARDAELLYQLDKKRAENAALAMEDLLTKIADALKTGDVRHMALTDQANAIAQAAETQGSRLIAPLQSRIDFLENLLESKPVDESNSIEPQALEN